MKTLIDQKISKCIDGVIYSDSVYDIIIKQDYDLLSQKILEALHNEFDKEALENNKAVVRDMIKEKLEKYGQIFVFFKGIEKLIVRIVSKKKHPFDIPEVIDVISDFPILFPEIYKQIEKKKDSVLIRRNHLEMIKIIVTQINLAVDSRELTRYIIKEAFNFPSSTIMTFINKKLFIKMPSGKVVIERYNGLPERELEELENTYFESQSNSKKRMFLFVKNLVEKDSIFHRFTFFDFQQQWLNIFLHGLKEFYSKIIDEESIVIESFVQYVTRKYYSDIFIFLTDYILHHLHKKNPKISDFVESINGNTIYANSQKYIIPSLKDDNGNRWTVNAIKNILSLYHEQKEELQKYEDKLSTLKDETARININKFNEEIKDIDAKYQYYKALTEETKETITNKRKELSSLRKEAKATSSKSHIEELEFKISQITQELKLLAKDELKASRNRNSLERKLNSVKNQKLELQGGVEGSKSVITAEEKRLLNLQSNFKKAESSYIKIKLMLAKTLSSKSMKAY